MRRMVSAEVRTTASCGVDKPTSNILRSHSQFSHDGCLHILQVLLKMDVCMYPRIYFRVSNATWIALSKTSFRPCCVFAEHSKTISPPSSSHSACAASRDTRLAPLAVSFARAVVSVRRSALQPTRMNGVFSHPCPHPLTSGSHLGGGRTVE